MSDHPGNNGAGTPRSGHAADAGLPLARPAISRPTWLAAAIAVIVVVVVIAIATGLWLTIGSSQISLLGWIALILGIVVALGLWIGLMSLMFISSRRGYDDL